MMISRSGLFVFAIAFLSAGLYSCGANEQQPSEKKAETVVAPAADAPKAAIPQLADTPKIAAAAPAAEIKKPEAKDQAKIVAPVPVKEAPVATAQTPAVKAESFEHGKELLSKSDCLACHKLDTKLVGPAYKDVADKYAATNSNIEMLATKVINGGTGNWGQIPMSAHPALNEDDAKEMVKYILSLKSK